MQRIALAYCLISTSIKMCSKERIIELIYDFIVFETGIKKLPRAHQYFGVKESQNMSMATREVLFGIPKEVVKVSPWYIWQNGYGERITQRLV